MLRRVLVVRSCDMASGLPGAALIPAHAGKMACLVPCHPMPDMCPGSATSPPAAYPGDTPVAQRVVPYADPCAGMPTPVPAPTPAHAPVIDFSPISAEAAAALSMRGDAEMITDWEESMELLCNSSDGEEALVRL